MYHKQSYILVLLTIALFFAGCTASGDFPGREYMPDMAHSQAYEAYAMSRDAFTVENGDTVRLFNGANKTALLPVANTVPRGHLPYYYPDTPEGYEAAGENVLNPLTAKHDQAAGLGKLHYQTYCAVCHGEAGAANGTIVAAGKYPAPPSYFTDAILSLPEGKMFHSVHYGKNLMGSYASQLSKQERWEVVSYIKQMQAEYLAKEKGIPVKKAVAMLTGKNTFKPAAAPATTEPAQPAKPVVEEPKAAPKKVVATDSTAAPEAKANEPKDEDAHEEHSDEATPKAVPAKVEAPKETTKPKPEAATKAATDKDKTPAVAPKPATEKPAPTKADTPKPAEQNAVDKAKAAATSKAEKAKATIDSLKRAASIKRALEAKKAAEEAKKKAAAAKANKAKAVASELDKLKEKPLKKGQKINLNNVFFESSSAKLKNKSFGELNKAVNLLKSNPTSKIEIGGHTDNTGSATFNTKLSNDRAKAVFDYLVKKGVKSSNLKYKGYGPDKPVAPNSTEAGKAKNRRTELKVL